MKKEQYLQEERASSAFLDKVLANIDDSEQKIALKIALLQMMPEGSIRTAELKRKNVAGASTDMLRTYAAHTRSTAFYLSQLAYGVQLQEAMREIQRQDRESKYTESAETITMQDVAHELRIRDALNAKAPIRTRTEVLTELGFVSYLTSPSYWLINSTQPLLITTPYLGARYGVMKANKAMSAAYKAVMPEVLRKMRSAKYGFGFLSGKNVPHELFDFLTSTGSIGKGLVENISRSEGLKYKQGVMTMLVQIGETNLIDMTFAADIKALAEGVSTKKREKLRKFIIDWARIMPHLIEVMNRSVTATAAYELARDAGKSHQEAVQAAIDAIAATQFDYSSINKPRYFSEKQFALARPIFMFMQHMQHMYYLLLRSIMLNGVGKQVMRKLLKGERLTPEEKEKALIGIKTFMYITASHVMVAGTIGGLFEPIKWALGLGLWMLSLLKGEDEPFDPEAEYRRLLDEMFGKHAGMVIAKGLPTLVGLDLSTRVNLNRLMFYDNPARGEGRDAVRNFLVQLAGPIYSMAETMADGFKNVAEGDVARGIEQILAPTPKLFRDMIKVVRTARNGLMDNGGNVIYPPSDINPLDLFWMSMGFSPAKISEFYTERRAVKNAEQYYSRWKSRILEQWQRATPEERLQLRIREIPRYNRAVPDPSMKIDVNTLRRSERGHRRTEQAARLYGGVPLSRSKRAIYEKYGGFGVY